MTDFKKINLDDIPPYFRHLVRDAVGYLDCLRVGYERTLSDGYLDPDGHEGNGILLKALLKLNDEIYALGRVQARAAIREHGFPMRGEKAAIERLVRFTRENPESSGVLRFISMNANDDAPEVL